MKRRLSLALVLGMVVSLVIAIQPASAVTFSSAVVTLDCTSFTYSLSYTFDRDNTGAGNEAYYVEITDGAGKVLYRYDNSAPVGYSGSESGGDSFTALPDYNPLTYRVVSIAGNGLPEQISLSVPGTCAGLPTYVSPAAGRDMVDLPAQAVVGEFVTTTALLYAPDANATTDTVMEIGKTLWVLGVDSTGQFYQVLMSGNIAWVPVSSMGPNYDDVWNGTPLPTTVVN